MDTFWGGIYFLTYSRSGCPLLNLWVGRESESEKLRQRVSNADRKVFVNPESFATSSLLAEEFPDMQNVWMNWKVSGQSLKCLDNQENVSG